VTPNVRVDAQCKVPKNATRCVSLVLAWHQIRLVKVNELLLVAHCQARTFVQWSLNLQTGRLQLDRIKQGCLRAR
jgi:hypothetical protein